MDIMSLARRITVRVMSSLMTESVIDHAGQTS
jgi:hypothetical protein